MDIDKHGSVAFGLARRLVQYQANRIGLPDWIAPGWFPDAWRRAAGTGGAQLARLRAGALEGWLAREGLPVPAYRTFRGDSGRLGALALDDALAVLCLRALYGRRAELRYWVDRESRDKVCAWLGRHGAAALRWLMAEPRVQPVDRWIRDFGMHPLDHLDERTLSWEGFCLFRASGMCEPDAPAGLLRLAWARDAVAAPWLQANDADATRDDSRRVLMRLDDFFAEEETR
ncbi:hypothetical protein CFB89_22610 [Burkholderia sp. AU16741]|uniref:type III secretion protein HrpB4 n=1 Tax=Burkholderia sp. AU16741 TaxID=2015347 RepID=UPI000B7ACB08|nr:type III secretion protein HrpB4 [Burkholderia sp. AU16741]OXI30020.1 hypothetical protein CFB89_22610 [Burkholderia sp. AU16741]